MRKGIIPPLVTPLTEQERLDPESLRRLLEHVLAGGVHGVFVLGTNGEGLALCDSVKEEVASRTVEVVAGRVPVLANVSDLSTARALENVRWAQRAEADEVVATPPFYFPYSPEAIEYFFRQLADASPLPVWIYENPARTAVTTPFEVIARLAEHENIIGVKYSGADTAFFARLVRELASPGFVVFTGLARDNVAVLELGADGIVPGVANVIPDVMVRLYDAVESGKIEEAKRLQSIVDKARRIYGSDMEWWPAAPKVILHEMGILATETCAAPFPRLSGEERRQVLRVWAEVEELMVDR